MYQFHELLTKLTIHVMYVVCEKISFSQYCGFFYEKKNDYIKCRMLNIYEIIRNIVLSRGFVMM